MMSRKTNLYYQNTRGLRTKSEAFFANVCESEYDVICLTETWLNASCTNQSYFSNQYSVFWKDRSYTEKIKNGGGVLIACKSSFRAVRRGDLETYEECVWVEVPASDGSNCLLGCYYFPPNSDTRVFVEHFTDLDSKVDFSNYKVHIYGDFNLPKVDWSADLIQSDCTGIHDKAQRLFEFINFNQLFQHNTIKNVSGNILDLIITNAPVFDIDQACDTLVPVDKFHPPFSLHFFLSFQVHNTQPVAKFRYAYGDYEGL